MTVRVYRWDDAETGVPVLNYSAGALTTLLKKCLIDGYGSKAGAGWTLAYNGTNEYGFTNSVAAGGSGKGVKVSHASNSIYPIFVGFESIDSGTGATTDSFPTTGQVSTGLIAVVSATADTTARPWMMVADEKRFYLWIGRSNTTAQGLGNSTYHPMIFAGDPVNYNPADPYGFTVIGAYYQDPNGHAMASIGASHTTALSGHYTDRSYNGTYKSINSGKVGDPTVSVTTMGTGGLTYPDPHSGSMLLSKVRVTDGGSAGGACFRGELPGLYQPLHSLPGNPGDTFTGSGDLAGKTFVLLSVGGAGSVTGRVALEISNTW